MPTTRPSAAVWAPGPDGDGLSGVHVHMSNTLNTPVEALEYALPVPQVTRYALRHGSGGSRPRRGGDGLVRCIQFLAPATVTILAERGALRAVWPGRAAIPEPVGRQWLDGQRTVATCRAR